MKRSLTILALIALTSLTSLSSRAEDWITTTGDIYRDVKVALVEDDAVTIVYNKGAALVPLAKLSPVLQERFHYDAVKARATEKARLNAGLTGQKAVKKMLTDIAAAHLTVGSEK